MLAGYTAAIVGFPSVKSARRDIRYCRRARHRDLPRNLLRNAGPSLIFPRPVGDALQRRLAVWLADADRWALDILRTRDAEVPTTIAATSPRPRARSNPLGAPAVRYLASARDHGRGLTLHGRMVLLIPLLSGIPIAWRLSAKSQDRQVRTVVNAITRWIESGASGRGRPELVARLEALAAERAGRDWSSLLVESLLVRLSRPRAGLGDCHALTPALCEPGTPWTRNSASAVARANGGRCTATCRLRCCRVRPRRVAIRLSCAVWIGTGWSDGASAAVLSAVFCCLFATMDDPVPAMAGFGILAWPRCRSRPFYVFAILPADRWIPDAGRSCLLPPLVLLGSFLPDPAPCRCGTRGGPGILQCGRRCRRRTAPILPVHEHQSGSVRRTPESRSSSTAVDAVDGRRGERGAPPAPDLEAASRAWRAPGSAPAHADFAAALVDRLGLLAPKLAVAVLVAQTPQPSRRCASLRIAMNLWRSRNCGRLSGEPRARLRVVLGRGRGALRISCRPTARRRRLFGSRTDRRALSALAVASVPRPWTRNQRLSSACAAASFRDAGAYGRRHRSRPMNAEIDIDGVLFSSMLVARCRSRLWLPSRCDRCSVGRRVPLHLASGALRRGVIRHLLGPRRKPTPCRQSHEHPDSSCNAPCWRSAEWPSRSPSYWSAIVRGRQLWRHYQVEPWTRDGRVRADVVEIAPDVSGLVTRVEVANDQPVKHGQPLFYIDRDRFELALRQAKRLWPLSVSASIRPNGRPSATASARRAGRGRNHGAGQSRSRRARRRSPRRSLPSDLAALNLHRTVVSRRPTAICRT